MAVANDLDIQAPSIDRKKSPFSPSMISDSSAGVNEQNPRLAQPQSFHDSATQWLERRPSRAPGASAPPVSFSPCSVLRYTTFRMRSITSLDNLWMGRPRSIAAALLESDSHRAIVDPGPGSTLGTLHQQLYARGDRKSTRLNSSHTVISYAVFCLKKKKQKNTQRAQTQQPPQQQQRQLRRPQLIICHQLQRLHLRKPQLLHSLKHRH